MMLDELSIASQGSSVMKDSWRSNNFSGIDGIMLASVVKSFNFTPILIKPDGADFGYKGSDGQFLGNFRKIFFKNKIDVIDIIL